MLSNALNQVIAELDLGEQWYTTSETHEVFEIQTQTSTKFLIRFKPI